MCVLYACYTLLMLIIEFEYILRLSGIDLFFFIYSRSLVMFSSTKKKCPTNECAKGEVHNVVALRRSSTQNKRRTQKKILIE